MPLSCFGTRQRGSETSGRSEPPPPGSPGTDTARALLDVYNEVCDGSPAPTAALERREGLMHGGVSEDAMRLVGPGGALPRDVERPLLALATHPQVGSPVFRALKAGYRASARLRRRYDGDS